MLAKVFILIACIVFICDGMSSKLKDKRAQQLKLARILSPKIHNLESDTINANNVTWLYATAEVNPNIEIPESIVSGIVHFRQQVIDGVGGPTEYMVSVTGFNNTDEILQHGTHIHTYGTIREGCSGSEGHYNPTDSRHGLPEDTFRHIGDLGNLIENPDGSVTELTSNDRITLMGEYSIMGRTWDVHEFDDDGIGLGGAQGGSGPRLACGVVAASDGSAWETP